MKALAVATLLALLPLSTFAKPAPASAPTEPRVAVQRIVDKSAGHGEGCDFWHLWSTPGDAVRELLVDEIRKVGGVTLLERETIGDLYEQEFQRANLDESTVAERKKFLAANLAVAGAISEFEWCVSRAGTGLDIGGLLGVGELGVSHETNKAHVALDLRLIDVKTGRIVETFTSEGSSDESGFSVAADAFGVRLKKADFRRTPLGKALREAVAKAASKVAEGAKRAVADAK